MSWEVTRIFMLHAGSGIIIGLAAPLVAIALFGWRGKQPPTPATKAELDLLTRPAFVPRLYLAHPPAAIGPQRVEGATDMTSKDIKAAIADREAATRGRRGRRRHRRR